MKPSSLPTLSLLLLTSACGVEHIELRPRPGAEPTREVPIEQPALDVSAEGETPVADDPVSSIDQLPGFGGLVEPELPDPPPALATGCSKLDLLFVLDNSFSMLDAQSKVSSAFPGLVNALGQTAVASFERCARAYADAGYALRELPLTDVHTRAEFVLAHMGL